MSDEERRNRGEVPALELQGVSKRYGPTLALDDLRLTLAAGEIRGLVGENGAGKSSLIKAVAGAMVPDTGTVTIGGHRLTPPTPTVARRLGVSVLFQERQIAPDLSVAENVLLGALPRRLWGGVDWPNAYRRAATELERVGIELDPRLSAGRLTPAEQQSIEIARAISRDARVLIMDEPTAALSGTESERLFSLLRNARERGVAVLYVSHHLPEIFELVDSVTVMRDGCVVATQAIETVELDRLVELMFGRSLEGEVAELDEAPVDGEVLVQADHLVVGNVLRDVSLDVRAGEIVAVTGGVGSGRRELARCLAGAQRPDRGVVRVGRGLRRVRSPHGAARAGVAFVPEDRKREGVFLELDLTENINVATEALHRSPIVRPRRRRGISDRWITRLDVRAPGSAVPAGALSGGNQQKVILGRWLEAGARVFVLDEPTAGIDINAKLDIYELLKDLAADGAALVVFSSDFEEIRLLAHRVLVLRRDKGPTWLGRKALSERSLFEIGVAP